MADPFTRRRRSEIMSRVKGRGNELTELRLIGVLRRSHFTGWRRHVKLFGQPDFIFRRRRVAIFVDGCFWHGCPKHRSIPVANSEFWQRKLAKNRERDKLVNRGLKAKGWRILRIWQHELLKRNEARLVAKIADVLGVKARPRPRPLNRR